MAAQAFIALIAKNNFMKKILALILFSFLFASCLQKISQKSEIAEEKVSEEFVQGSEDIPLLVTMEKISEDSLGFDSDAGSIMSSSYQTKTDLKKVRSFYSRTLPQLGWKMIEDSGSQSIFKRDNEKLEIEFINENDKNIVRFFISSAI